MGASGTASPDSANMAGAKEHRAIPRAPGRIPLIGHLRPLLRDPWTFLASLPKLDSGLVRVQFGPVTVVVVCDLELTNQVLRQDRVFDKGGPLFDVARAMFRDNVLTAQHDSHRRYRRLIQPSFHHGRLPNYADVMSREISAVTTQWQDGAYVDILSESLRITARTFLATMYSGALPPMVLDRTLADMTILIGDIYRQLLTPAPLRRLPTPANRRYQRARAGFRATMNTVLAQRRADDVDRGDLLSTLRAAAGEDEPLTDAEICDQLTIFFVAGTETTASALAWSLHLVALHPDIEQRLHTEVDRVLQGDAAQFGHLPALQLTRHVVTEALRLYTPGWLLTRTITTDTQLGGYALPRGTALVVSPYLIHHREDLYADPEKFDPDRWDTPGRIGVSGAFLPFGRGPRGCVGESFALTQATLALATIIARWRLRHRTGARVRPAISAALAPKGLHMQVATRVRGRSR